MLRRILWQIRLSRKEYWNRLALGTGKRVSCIDATCYILANFEWVLSLYLLSYWIVPCFSPFTCQNITHHLRLPHSNCINFVLPVYCQLHFASLLELLLLPALNYNTDTSQFSVPWRTIAHSPLFALQHLGWCLQQADSSNNQNWCSLNHVPCLAVSIFYIC